MEKLRKFVLGRAFDSLPPNAGGAGEIGSILIRAGLTIMLTLACDVHTMMLGLILGVSAKYMFFHRGLTALQMVKATNLHLSFSN